MFEPISGYEKLRPLGALFQLSNPFDHVFKNSVEDEELGLMRVAAKLDIPEGALVEHLDRELVAPSLRVDHLYRITVGDESRLMHMEAFSAYHSDWRRKHARYAALIWAKYELKLTIFMFLLTQRGVPPELEEQVVVDAGDLELRARVRVIRMWEVPAQDLLDTRDAAMAAWVPLSNHSEEQLWKAARTVAESGDSEIRSRMTLLYGLRYREMEVLEAMLSDEILQESVYYQKILKRGFQQGFAEGWEQGRQEGLEECRLDGERQVIRRQLMTKFGPLTECIDATLCSATANDLERWGIQLLTAESVEAVFQ